MVKDTSANWQVIDTSTLDIRTQEKYNEYKNQYRQMKEARGAFEDCLRDKVQLPSGKRLAIAYNFGKLSVAVVDAAAKPAAKGSVSLADIAKR